MLVGHEHVYVRTSAAGAISEAVEHWPQAVKPTMDVLQELYREKVTY